MGSHFDDEELSMSLSSPPAKHPSKPSAASQARTNPKQQRNGGLQALAADLPRGGKTEQRIGQYSVKKTLGEGSFGKVKLAVHRVSGQEVALKIISRKKLISRDMAGRVEREIQYLQLLRHPHIIKLYTVITTPNEIIMVLEYAGGELFDYIVKHGKMSEDKARRFFQQIVCAVEYCHRHKIVHRDLKPENLLLDSELNVKIADFGLSNIMTDGNFLKTSCGSPNYAAPEVISGKLYAGPEVDVWSCGIILYVLLVGRLPFDDDFIPNLFRKINSGTYHTPSYLSSGARTLIHRMLKVNPVQRITIQEIRQDPWFNENLEDYLKPPVEEFIDTGVDPNKAIDPKKLAPGKSPAVQEEIHQSVIGKLGKTMGYAKDDVQEALGKDEPNAIKDAYLIVRENQIMQNNPSLVTSSNVQPFMAQSPPAWNAHGTPQHITSPLALAAEAQIPSISSFRPPEKEQPPPAAVDSKEKDKEKDAYVNKISILTSSLPFYHNQYMVQKKKRRDAERQSRPEQGSTPLEATTMSLDSAQLEKLSLDTSGATLSPAEQTETIKRLKPHSRSTVALQSITSQPINPPVEEAKPDPKKRGTRWQFGIRSRNFPHEAMHCVYKALLAQGAEWEAAPPPKDTPTQELTSYPVYVQGATRLNETIQTRANSPENGKSANDSNSKSNSYTYSFDYEGKDSRNDDTRGRSSRKHMVRKRDGSGEETDDEEIDPNSNKDEDYAPKDPWCIRVRWRKDGMHPVGVINASSAHSSRQDLQSNPGRRVSVVGGLGSAAASTTSFVTSPEDTRPTPDHSCYVYMDVQLYTLEPASDKTSGTYLVDFKCAGYEALVERALSESEKVLVGSGHRVLDKDVTSPQPFLDLTNKLVIHLASGGG